MDLRIGGSEILDLIQGRNQSQPLWIL